MKNIIAALVKAKNSFAPILKDKTNPFYKSKYAPLDSILSAIEPALLENGLIISQSPKVLEGGKVVLITTIFHESGESITGEYPLAENQDPQKLGSVITYARRYALCAMLSLAPDDDDDGNRSKSDNRQRPQLQEDSTRVWSSWKTEDDALIWAAKQLPEYDLNALKNEFSQLTPKDGKKAPAWVQRVRQLKEF